MPSSIFCKLNVIRVESQTSSTRHLTSRGSSTWDASVNALLAVYNRLFFCGASDMVVFPFGIVRGLTPAGAVAAERIKDVKALLLPDMRRATPPFKSAPPYDRPSAWRYVDGVEKAVRKLHTAGAVHGDVYISNIFHRWVDDRLETKFMDFDISFLITTPCPVSYDRLQRKLYRLCEDQQWRNKTPDVKTLNSTLDLAEVNAMRHCLCSEEGYARWRKAADTEDVSELNKFSRWMGEQYDQALEGKTFSEAMAAEAAVYDAGTTLFAAPAELGAQLTWDEAGRQHSCAPPPPLPL